MYIVASIVFVVAVFALCSSLINFVGMIALKKGTAYPLAIAAIAAYIAAYLAFIYQG